MNKIYTRSVEFDFDGNCIVEIPEEICKYLELKDKDVIVWEMIEDKVIIRKRKEL
nr:MAG: hypothetical protein [Caudoviricetes sp.]